MYFTARGPWRAIGSVNSYDFASVYGAARCWLSGENPYDMRLVDVALHSAGDDPATLPNTDPPPSVYLPSAFPLITPVALLPWKAARLTWSLLSIAVFAFSAALLIRCCELDTTSKWLLAAGMLFFSPTTSGLSTGNPSVISCALTLAAILLALRHRMLAAAMLLGLAHSLKPQISIAGLAVFLAWGYWRAVALSFAVPVASTLISFLRIGRVEQYKLWLTTLRQGLAAISLPGGMNDPSPANYFSYHLVNASAIASMWIHDSRVVSTLVWIGTATLAGVYLWCRNRSSEGDTPLRDAAFFCTLSLIPVYHRYYDAQLLLGIVPWLLASRRKRQKQTTLIWSGLLILLFPLQAILAESHHGLDPASLAGFLLLRHQPLILILLSLLVMPRGRVVGHSEGGHGAITDAKVCNS